MRRLTRHLGYALLWLAALLGVIGIALETPWIIACASCLIGLRFAVADIARLKSQGISPVAVAAISIALSGFADTIGLLSMATNHNSTYDKYADVRYLLLASIVALFGWTSMILGIGLANRRFIRERLLITLPMVRGRISTKALVSGGVVLSLLAMASTFLDSRPQLGAVYSLFLLTPHFVAFVLARIGFARKQRGLIVVALAIAFLASIRALLFAYLRSDALLPLIAFALGAWLGGRSLAPFRSKYFLPLYLFGAIFVIYFRAFGDIRASSVTSVGRLTAIIEYQQQLREEDDEAAPAVLSRLTSFNQLSQIGRVVHEDGFYRGATLSYLSYAFIPRFLWPGKPKIAKGSWFAVRIGHGYQKADGRYSNAVNMTVPGELYLNFGLVGVVFGCVGFGLLIGALWAKTEFWENPRNIVGSAFGFYILWNSLKLGSDLQIAVTLIAMYLLFIAIAGAVALLRRQRSAVGVPRFY